MVKKVIVGSCIIAGCWINNSKACTITELNQKHEFPGIISSILVKDYINMEEKGFPGIISSIKPPKESFQWGFLSSFNRCNFKNEPQTPAPVPEPSTALLLGCGLIGLGFFFRKRKLKKN
jgi:hypothetical protein